MNNNEIGRMVGGEYFSTREGVSARSLLEDNKSPRAEEGRVAHAANKAAGRLILVSQCSDSRNIPIEPEREAIIRSVGGAPDFASFSPALMDSTYAGVILEGHFAGKQEIEGQSPEGCGGRTLKDELLNGRRAQSDIEQWVHEHLAHSDLILDLFERSGKISRQAGKDLLLLARDHLDQTVYPIMAFLKEPLMPPTINMREYDPAIVYKNGIPHLTSGQLKDSVFEDYLNDYYSKRFPSLHEKFGRSDRISQETQNPKILLLTTETMSPELWIPNLAEKTGRIFVETIARTRNPETGRINVAEEDLTCVIKQTDYPFDHFPRLSTIIVLTEESEQSERVLTRLKQKDKFKSWLARNPNHKLIIGQINNGVLNEGIRTSTAA
jgi:hypothetical protein